MVRCPQCGHENEDDLNYCGKCGLKLDSLICQNCNTKNNKENSFCINCGKSFNTNIIQQPNQNNTKYQQHNSLKALLIGSLVIAVTYIILEVITAGLYFDQFITYNTRDSLNYLYYLLAGIIGMFIFNKSNNGEHQLVNTILVSFIGLILIILYYGLSGGSIASFTIQIFSLILITMGAFISNYIENKDNI